MAGIPFLLLLWWFGSWLDSKEKNRNKELDRIIKWCENTEDKNFRVNSKPKYRMKEVSPENDELFMTDLGDFDEAFKL